jgi:hypothetical protein
MGALKYMMLMKLSTNGMNVFFSVNKNNSGDSVTLRFLSVTASCITSNATEIKMTLAGENSAKIFHSSHDYYIDIFSSLSRKLKMTSINYILLCDYLCLTIS